MKLTEGHITGFIAGLGVAGLGYYLYKRNQPAIDGWLRNQGIQIPTSGHSDTSNMNLEDLVLEKERLEDLIAEREMEVQKQANKTAAPAEG